MRIIWPLLLSLIAGTTAGAVPFAPRAVEEAYGVGTLAWRFASSLPPTASGVIELCYAEEGESERVLGRVDVRPFRSSEAGSPDLRIVFSKAEVDGKPMIILIVGYGIRSGTFVVDVPRLTSHSLTSLGTPRADASGNFTLVGFGERVTTSPNGTAEGMRGRLFFRFR